MRWKSGQCGNPAGHGPGRPKIAGLIAFEVRQAARAHCPEAMERLATLMRSNDERVSLAACIALIERAFGKPQFVADAATAHRFAVACVPEVMSRAEWLERRGQPNRALLPPPDGSA